MKISEFLSPLAVVADLQSRSKPEMLEELARALAAAHPELNPGRLTEVLRERERQGTTGIGDGVAIPHGKLPGLPGIIAAFGMAREGVEFDSIDRKPAQLFFALVAPVDSPGVHLKALARVSRLFKNPQFREAILHAREPEAIYGLIAQEDARS
jgi:PTS system nitrogen regulatory IIA component